MRKNQSSQVLDRSAWLGLSPDSLDGEDRLSGGR